MSTITLEAEKRYREQYDDEPWTTECLVDEVFLNLCKTQATITKDNGRTITVRKYYRGARELMKWIPVIKLPSNEYVINLSDLTPRIREGLESVSKTSITLRYVLTQAVGRIFENLDFDFYHLSVARNLRVRLEA